MIVLVSEDPELYRMSREILADLKRADLLLAGAVPAQELGWADICILDWSSIPSLTAQAPTAGCRRLYLIDRDQAERVSRDLPPSTIGVLMKPVARASLKLALEQALGAAPPGDSHPPAAPDRDDILQSLLHAYLRLQEYDYDRTNFLARAVHDFRAPLTALNGYCGLLLEGLLGPLNSDQKEVLARMQRSSRRLARMATSMFELTTRCRRKPESARDPASMAECVDQAIHELRGVCEERDIAVSVQMSEAPRPLYLDSGQIEQVLMNLLDNASRFTPRHGFIDIAGYPFFWERRSGVRALLEADRRGALVRDPNSYRVDIKDNGPAIPEEFVPQLFEEYTSNTDPSNRSGCGLGLAICRSIVRMHQGNIWADSRSDGVVFSFVIPFGAPPAEAPRVSPAVYQVQSGASLCTSVLAEKEPF